MRALLPLAVVCLSAAAASAQAQGRKVTGFETHVVVAPVADQQSAAADAERRCNRYNRFANFRRMDGAMALFDCERTRREPGGGTGGLYQGVY